MLRDALERLPGEIETVELGVAMLELGQHAQSLVVMAEAAEFGHHLVERFLAGMAERRVAEIVGQSQRLGQILVEPQVARDAACDLRDFEAVRQPRPVMIAFVIDEDLGLVLQATKGRRMDDPVAVALEHRTMRALRLGI